MGGCLVQKIVYPLSIVARSRSAQEHERPVVVCSLCAGHPSIRTNLFTDRLQLQSSQL